MRKIKNINTLRDFLSGSMPGHVSAGLPKAGLLKVWRQVAGDAVAERAFPVQLRPDGELVVAVRGSVWRQELTMMAPAFLEKLAQEGFPFTKLRFVKALTPFNPPPEPPLPELSSEEEEELEERVAEVSDPELARVIKNAMRAELKARKAAGK
ncbi:DciA family protein [Dethiosulfatarculus sandiegensis]|nr:DUF721 domain-containing protein [Dethiosulfatarculus sandiegensis]